MEVGMYGIAYIGLSFNIPSSVQRLYKCYENPRSSIVKRSVTP